MTSGFVDRSKLVFPQGEPALSVESGAAMADGAFVIVTQAFCPSGHDLVAFPVFADCDSGTGHLRSIDLVRGGGGEVVAFCDVSGCRRSQVAEGLEVLALFDE